MSKLMKKSEIAEYRMKLIMGLRSIPIPNSTEEQRRLARVGAIYALEEVLGFESVVQDGK